MNTSASRTDSYSKPPKTPARTLLGRLVAAGTLVCAWTLAGPAPAQATTTAGRQGDVITVTAGNVGNNINIRRAGDVYEIWDHVDVHQTLPGCVRSGPYMHCPAEGVLKILVRTEGGDDKLYINLNVDTRVEAYGGDGNDRLECEGIGTSSCHGMAGNDTVIGSAGTDAIGGGPGDDRLFGRAAIDDINGGPGADRVNGEGGNDRLNGGPGVDSVDGGGGNDLIYGGPDGDYLNGGIGTNILNGEDGNDTFGPNPGEAGETSANGGAGNDTFYPWSLAESSHTLVMSGGPGFDAVSYLYSAGPVRADLDGVRDDGLDKPGPKDNILPDVERIDGGPFDNILTGNDSDNVLNGSSGGDDILLGLGGSDTLTGSYGDDVIVGGGGWDRMRGNQGDDRLDARDSPPPVWADLVDGGQGTDTCYLDPPDIRQGCDVFP
ncbi:calcium-binding protein [Arthrobacter sp. NPDC093125]|uniref:calcium-binding protein n=1 Tax=Arthrobacter sp. NPDC093125 TaxID=3363944 RepID=UPI003800BE25